MSITLSCCPRPTTGLHPRFDRAGCKFGVKALFNGPSRSWKMSAERDAGQRRAFPAHQPGSVIDIFTRISSDERSSPAARVLRALVLRVRSVDAMGIPLLTRRLKPSKGGGSANILPVQDRGGDGVLFSSSSLFHDEFFIQEYVGTEENTPWACCWIWTPASHPLPAATSFRVGSVQIMFQIVQARKSWDRLLAIRQRSIAGRDRAISAGDEICKSGGPEG